MSPLLRCFCTLFALLALAGRGFGFEGDDEVKDVPTPTITQDEVLKALGLEISKIRIIGIPKGERVSLNSGEGRPLATIS